MKLVKFTQSGGAAAEVYVNPQMVVTVRTAPKFTEIAMLGGASSVPFTIAVTETAEEVVAALA